MVENETEKKRKNCADALAVIQYKLRQIKKNSSAYGYRYLSLPELVDRVYEISGTLGVCITFDMEKLEGDLYKTTARMVYIETGESISSSVYGMISSNDIPVKKDGVTKTMNFMQWFGSCSTYMRRYALQNLLGLAADEDDDAGGKYNNNF